jgi:hypothetical protein
MKIHILSASIIVLVTAASTVIAAPRANGPVAVPIGPVTPTIIPQGQRDALLGPCRMDLSVESIELRKSGVVGGPFVANMIIKNIGTEAYDAPAMYAGAVFHATMGGSSIVTTTEAGDITLLQPGRTRRLTATIPQTAFDSTEFFGDLRGFINFGPDAPRCGRDRNPANDELRISFEQIRDWYNSPRQTVFVRR